MAPQSEFSRYGNTTRHRIKSGDSNTRIARDRYKAKKYTSHYDEYADEENVLNAVPIGRRADLDKHEEYGHGTRYETRRKEKEESTKILEEYQRQDDMRRKLRNMGYDEKAIDELLGQTAHLVMPARTPVYPKIHKDYIAVETLNYYSLPWEYDRQNPDYIVVLRDMSKAETDILFEHTRRLRAGRTIVEPARKEKEKEYAFYRRRSGKAQVVVPEPVIRIVPEEPVPVEAIPVVAPQNDNVEEVPEEDEEEMPFKRPGENLPESSLPGLSGEHSFRPKLLLESKPEVVDFEFDLSGLDHVSNDRLSNAAPEETCPNHGVTEPLQIESPLDIVQSNWRGDPLDTWQLGAQITALSSPPTQITTLSSLSAKSGDSTVKWYHMQRDLMNFAEFIAMSVGALQLNEADKMHVRSLLLQAQAEKEKPRTQGRQMEAVFIADNDFQDRATQQKETLSAVAFFSFPVFWRKQPRVNCQGYQGLLWSIRQGHWLLLEIVLRRQSLL